MFFSVDENGEEDHGVQDGQYGPTDPAIARYGSKKNGVAPPGSDGCWHSVCLFLVVRPVLLWRRCLASIEMHTFCVVTRVYLFKEVMINTHFGNRGIKKRPGEGVVG